MPYHVLIQLSNVSIHNKFRLTSWRAIGQSPHHRCLLSWWQFQIFGQLLWQLGKTIHCANASNQVLKCIFTQCGFTCFKRLSEVTTCQTFLLWWPFTVRHSNYQICKMVTMTTCLWWGDWWQSFHDINMWICAICTYIWHLNVELWHSYTMVCYPVTIVNMSICMKWSDPSHHDN